jgi:hypothetical protein
MERRTTLITRKQIRAVIGVALIISLAIAGYLTFYTYPQCGNYACFQTHMQGCSRVQYLNEEPEASWQYTILGKQGTDCQVQVTLLQAKQGSLDLDALRGDSMVCRYPTGVTTYPESNIDVCSGQLKEALQGVLIKKLYTYILNNVGQVNQSLNSAF